MKTIRQELPFTNKFGQIIYPGHEVFVITNCRHQTYVRKGVYLGYTIYTPWEGANPQLHVQARVSVKKYRYYDRLENKEYDFSKSYEYRRDNVVRVEYDSHRITTLFHNNILLASSSAEELARHI